MVKFLAKTHVFFLVSIQALASKTLDQASAQFAASALVTTDQLLAFKSKEELVLASGVNGVLAGAGDYFIDPAKQVLFLSPIYLELKLMHLVQFIFARAFYSDILKIMV